MTKFTLFIVSAVLGLLFSWTGISQTVPVGFPGLEDYYRRAQLMGKIDPTFSFTARPFNPVETLHLTDPFDPDSTLVNNRMTDWNGTFRFWGGKGFFQVLPQTVIMAYKRPVPISMNDGAMIPAKGFQTLYTGGVYAKLGPLSIRFQPEFVYAENAKFNGFFQDHTDQTWKAYYNCYNYIDLPERFGEGPYQRNYWGQSSIKLDFGPISFGLSNENLWWGPGYRNSLLMTNSAPGFKHLVLNTTRPIRTYIGNFEFQLVAGKLDSSGFYPAVLERNDLGEQWILQKPNDWRYFNGIVLTYMPKWIPGLFLGATRSFQMYSETLNGKIYNYLPVILPMTQKNTEMEDERNGGRDQLASVFIRWLFLKEHAEVYFEYGREDRSADFRDLYLDLSHSRAYNLGLRKLFPLNNKTNQQIEVIIEATQLESLLTKRWKSYTQYVYTWYTHSQIRHGYTHLGQMLGAGIGPGSNLQTLSLSWVNGIKKIGLQVERYVHNTDLLENAVLDTRYRWVDFLVSAIGCWDYKNLIFTAQIDGIQSINYQWFYNPTSRLSNYITGKIGDYWAPGKDVFTLQAQLGVTYRF